MLCIKSLNKLAEKPEGMKVTSIEPFQIETLEPSPPSEGRVRELLQEIADSVHGASSSDADSSENSSSVFDFLEFQRQRLQKKRLSEPKNFRIRAYLSLDRTEQSLADLGQSINRRA